MMQAKNDVRNTHRRRRYDEAKQMRQAVQLLMTVDRTSAAGSNVLNVSDDVEAALSSVQRGLQTITR